MRALVCSGFDGLAALALGELPDPQPGPRDVLVEVNAASLPFMDCLMVSGQTQLRPPLPFEPGTEAAGVVLAVGKDVTRFQPGDRVACGEYVGTFAERAAIDESLVTRIPDGLSFEVAATVRYAYGTAWSRWSSGRVCWQAKRCSSPARRTAWVWPRSIWLRTCACGSLPASATTIRPTWSGATARPRC